MQSALATTTRRGYPNALDRHGHLREGIALERAADITWTLAGPAIYNDLVRVRGWRPHECEHWLAHQLRFALLGVDLPGRR